MQSLMNIAYLTLLFCVVVNSAPQSSSSDPPVNPTIVPAIPISSTTKPDLIASSSSIPENIEEDKATTLVPPSRAPQDATPHPPLSRAPTTISTPEDIKQDSKVTSQPSTENPPSASQKDGKNSATMHTNLYFLSLASSVAVLMYSAI